MAYPFGGSAAIERVDADRADQHDADRPSAATPSRSRAAPCPICSDWITSAPMHRAVDRARRRPRATCRRSPPPRSHRARRTGRARWSPNRAAPKSMQAATAAEGAHQREHHHRDALGVDAGEFGGLWIAADRVDVAAEPGAPREEGHRDADHQRDQHRNRVAGAK